MRSWDEFHDHPAILDALDRPVAGIDAEL